jgi:hypothetical protein
MKRIDTSEFKKYMEYKKNGYFSENANKLAKELEEDFQERLKKGKI